MARPLTRGRPQPRRTFRTRRDADLFEADLVRRRRKAVARALRLLGGILGYAVELEQVQVNAARAVRPVRVPTAKTGRALSTREVEALRGALGEPWTVSCRSSPTPA